MYKITFIIPTIGRETLELSITSLLKQDDPNCKAIIIFDGIEPNIKCIDPRISILKCEKKGEGKNGAGNVRNYAVPFVETEWIAFLDDDDTIADDYVTCLQKQIEETSDLDVLIFRMKHKPLGRIIPSLDKTEIKIGNVGISFSLKTKIMKEDDHLFIPSGIEDYELLNTLLKNNYKIMFYPFVKYFVRSFPENITEKGTSTTFNFDVQISEIQNENENIEKI